MGNTEWTTVTVFEYDEEGRVSKQTETVTEKDITPATGIANPPAYTPWSRGGQITRPGDQPMVTWNANDHITPCGDVYPSTLDKAEEGTDRDDGTPLKFDTGGPLSEDPKFTAALKDTVITHLTGQKALDAFARSELIGREGIVVGGYL